MSKNKNAQVFHFDLYGKREEKYNFLLENNLKTVGFNELKNSKPNFFFVNKNTQGQVQF
jgi:hypothetical protein